MRLRRHVAVFVDHLTKREIAAAIRLCRHCTPQREREPKRNRDASYHKTRIFWGINGAIPSTNELEKCGSLKENPL